MFVFVFVCALSINGNILRNIEHLDTEKVDCDSLYLCNGTFDFFVKGDLCQKILE